MFRYRADVLAALPQHGLVPTPHTPPQLARAQVNELYCHELRRLRAQMLDGAFPKVEYAGRVALLRDKYRVLSLRAHEWAAVE